jgi:hypothetical protein
MSRCWHSVSRMKTGRLPPGVSGSPRGNDGGRTDDAGAEGSRGKPRSAGRGNYAQPLPAARSAARFPALAACTHALPAAPAALCGRQRCPGQGERSRGIAAMAADRAGRMGKRAAPAGRPPAAHTRCDRRRNNHGPIRNECLYCPRDCGCGSSREHEPRFARRAPAGAISGESAGPAGCRCTAPV